MVLTFQGCYSLVIKSVNSYSVDTNISVIPSGGKIDAFMGDTVKDPYGYKNMCRDYVKGSGAKSYNDYDAMAFYAFCDFKKMCNDSNKQHSRYYSDHVFNGTYCKNDYITWDLKFRNSDEDERTLRAIKNKVGSYDGTNALNIYQRAFKYMKANFTYVSDAEQFPYAPNKIYDVWFVNAERWTVGDCEDWTLKMIWILKDVAGIPTEKLYMVGAFAYTGEGHELPNAKDDKGMVWQLDNMLDAPVPAYYVYNGFGGKSNPEKGMGEIMRMDKVKEGWKVFNPKQLPKPCDLKY